MKKRTALSIFLSCLCMILNAQAGQGVYSFLNLPASSRLAGMGGNNVAIHDNDINMAFANPAQLSPETDKNLGLSYTSYLAGTSFGSAIYGFNPDQTNYLAIGILYVNYGQFQETNELNQILGTFSASDYALNLIYSHKLTDKWSIGANVKPIYSHYENYSSFGLATDIGLNFHDNETGLINMGLVARNIGTQIKAYYSADGGQHYESIPFEIQFGISKRFEHAPFRLSLTMNNLQKWDLTGRKGGDQLLEDNETSKLSFGSQLFRHAIFAVELIPSQSFYISLSYNCRRAAEMSVDNVRALSGFSGAAGIKISKIHAGFGIAQYQPGTMTYHLSITTNLSEFGL
jgi:hypothetical protein